MIEITTKLSVKELAPVLGRGVGYVYKMRMAGFAMDFDEETRCHVTTEGKARTWIKRTKFKVVRGKPETVWPSKKRIITSK
ncbi:MAG: hypothetical protein V4563_17420 [Pseudomonadota bacterium]